MPDNRCKIWPEFIAKKVAHSKDESRVIDVIDSPRAGGTYRIDRESAEWCAAHDDHESQRIKARLTTCLINQRMASDDRPMVTRDLINRLREIDNLSELVRAERLLYKLVNDANQAMNLSARSIVEPGLLAWSESVHPFELTRLYNLLKSIGFMESQGMVDTVTELGNQRIQELDASLNMR